MRPPPNAALAAVTGAKPTAMAHPFRPALDLLSQYAETHRDRRNIATHFVGVPMIVFALGVLLSHPAVEVSGWLLTPAWGVCAGAMCWYLTRGEWLLGVATSATVALLVLLAHQLPGGVGPWLGWGLGCFIVGWVVQFVGHYYEGRRPALVDDFTGLLVGPMFVVMEALALAGAFRHLVADIERRAGPTLLRNLAHPA
jgi:uncharacterized membrane protein YGL010W